MSLTRCIFLFRLVALKVSSGPLITTSDEADETNYEVRAVMEKLLKASKKIKCLPHTYNGTHKSQES